MAAALGIGILIGADHTPHQQASAASVPANVAGAVAPDNAGAPPQVRTGQS